MKHFSYFSKKVGFDISCRGDNLHDKSKPLFWEKIRKLSSICCLLNLWREVKVKVVIYSSGYNLELVEASVL